MTFIFALLLTPDAWLPPLSDLNRLPPRPVATDAIQFYIDQRYDFFQRRAADPANAAAHWQMLLDGNLRALEIWEAVAEAHGERDEEEGYNAGELAYRLALARLRALLGMGGERPARH